MRAHTLLDNFPLFFSLPFSRQAKYTLFVMAFLFGLGLKQVAQITITHGYQDQEISSKKFIDINATQKNHLQKGGHSTLVQ
jgi:hypothetical protein